MTRVIRVALPLVVSVVTLAACGGSSSAPHVATASPRPGQTGTAHATAPQTVTQRAVNACSRQINAAQSLAPHPQPPATPQEIQQATQFAHCMRQHGWPRFPDPDSRGGFELSNPHDGPPSKNDPSWQACRARLAAGG